MAVVSCDAMHSLATSCDVPYRTVMYGCTWLQGELLLPLRSLNEAQVSMHRTFSGQPVPPAPVAAAVRDLTAAVLSREVSLAARPIA